MSLPVVLTLQQKIELVELIELWRDQVDGGGHTYAKAVLEREPAVSFKWLQSQLGHSDLKTTMDVYGHFEAATKQAVATSLEGAFQV